MITSTESKDKILLSLKTFFISLKALELNRPWIGRLAGALKAANISSPEEFLNLDRAALLKINQFNYQTVDKIAMALNEAGIQHKLYLDSPPSKSKVHSPESATFQVGIHGTVHELNLKEIFQLYDQVKVMVSKYKRPKA